MAAGWCAVQLQRAALTGDLSQVALVGATDWQIYKPMATSYFGIVCERGHLRVAQWLHETFLMIGNSKSLSLRCACAQGHLHIAQWLHNTFSLTAADARARDNYALCWTCRNGHLHVVQWLCTTYGFPWPAGYARWTTRREHTVWYLQPHTLAASHLPSALLADTLRRL